MSNSTNHVASTLVDELSDDPLVSSPPYHFLSHEMQLSYTVASRLLTPISGPKI